MIGGSEHLDEEDRAFLGTMVPEDAFDPQMIAVVSWVDAETGEGRWMVYAPDAVSVSHKVGLLELAKAHLMQPALPPRDGDDD